MEHLAEATANDVVASAFRRSSLVACPARLGAEAGRLELAPEAGGVLLSRQQTGTAASVEAAELVTRTRRKLRGSRP